jgi:hypothetical protein
MEPPPPAAPNRLCPTVCALAISAPPRQTMTTVVIRPVMPNIRMAPTARMPSTTAAAPTAVPSVEKSFTAVAQPITPPACAVAVADATVAPIAAANDRRANLPRIIVRPSGCVGGRRDAAPGEFLLAEF